MSTGDGSSDACDRLRAERDALREQVATCQAVIRQLSDDGGMPPPLWGGGGWTPRMVNEFDNATREQT